MSAVEGNPSPVATRQNIDNYLTILKMPEVEAHCQQNKRTQKILR